MPSLALLVPLKLADTGGAGRGACAGQAPCSRIDGRAVPLVANREGSADGGDWNE